MKKLLLSAFIIILALKADAQTPCDKIEFNNDEVRGFKSYTTPIDINSPNMVYINKIIEPNKKPQYYIHFRVNEPLGKVVNGAYIILENGKRISRPNEEINLEIDNEDSDGITHFGYKQGVSIQLTAADILLLKSSPIAKYAISYLTETVYNSKELNQMFQCLLMKN
jgi:hypothetical protein